MQQIEPTLSVTIDDTTHEVSSLTPQIQQMIKYMDDWRQKEVDLTSELLMVRGAIRDIQTSLVASIRESTTEAVTDSEAPAAE